MPTYLTVVHAPNDSCDTALSNIYTRPTILISQVEYEHQSLLSHINATIRHTIYIYIYILIKIVIFLNSILHSVHVHIVTMGLK